jgi:hypothetical protein
MFVCYISKLNFILSSFQLSKNLEIVSIARKRAEIINLSELINILEAFIRMHLVDQHFLSNMIHIFEVRVKMDYD